MCNIYKIVFLISLIRIVHDETTTFIVIVIIDCYIPIFFENLALLSVNLQYVVYTALAWRNKTFGTGIEFAWGVETGKLWALFVGSFAFSLLFFWALVVGSFAFFSLFFLSCHCSLFPFLLFDFTFFLSFFLSSS